MPRTTRRIAFYTRPGCHLCDEALDRLSALSDEMGAEVTLEEINILDDPALYAHYRYTIPVIRFDPDSDGPTLYAPISESDLRRALESHINREHKLNEERARHPTSRTLEETE